MGSGLPGGNGWCMSDVSALIVLEYRLLSTKVSSDFLPGYSPYYHVCFGIKKTTIRTVQIKSIAATIMTSVLNPLFEVEY